MKCPRCDSPLRLDAWSGMALHLECQNRAAYPHPVGYQEDPVIRLRTKVCGWSLPLYGSGLEEWFITRMDEFLAALPQEKLLEALKAKEGE